MRGLLENDPFVALAGRCPRWIAGIVGGERPSRYSASPALWNTLFEKLGLDAAFVAFDLARGDDMPAFLAAFLDLPGALDLTVTQPYKATAWQALRGGSPSLQVVASERVRALECLNHLIVDRAGGRLVAENTDGVGMLRALAEALRADTQGLAGCRVLLVGAGGAAASIGLELVRAGASLTIVDLLAEDASALAARLARVAQRSIASGDWRIISRVAPASRVVISAISAGTPLAAAEIARLPEETLLVDVRYGAAAEFAHAAAAAGRAGRVLDGRAMLFGQFAAAAALACPVTGVGAGALEKALAEMQAEVQAETQAETRSAPAG